MKIGFNAQLEILKTYEDKDEFHVVGYASTQDLDLQGDIVTGEALESSQEDLLQNSTVLLNHDPKQPIGKVVKVWLVRGGMLLDVLISKTVPEVIQTIKEGVLNKFSIKGKVLDAVREYVPKLKRTVNVIKRMFLVEVSLVSLPANPKARALGWYISKALGDFEKNGGETEMAEKDVKDEALILEEESKPEMKKEEEKKEEKQEEKSEQKPEEKAATEEEKEKEYPSEPENLKQNVANIVSLLDKLIAGETTETVKKVLQQVKAMVDKLTGVDYPSKELKEISNRLEKIENKLFPESEKKEEGKEEQEKETDALKEAVKSALSELNVVGIRKGFVAKTEQKKETKEKREMTDEDWSKVIFGE